MLILHYSPKLFLERFILLKWLEIWENLFYWSVKWSMFSPILKIFHCIILLNFFIHFYFKFLGIKNLLIKMGHNKPSMCYSEVKVKWCLVGVKEFFELFFLSFFKWNSLNWWEGTIEIWLSTVIPVNFTSVFLFFDAFAVDVKNPVSVVDQSANSLQSVADPLHPTLLFEQFGLKK